jgi:hypothetical protein
MTTPILLNHDPKQVIGAVAMIGNRLVVEMTADVKVSKTQLCEIFGNPGFVPLRVIDDYSVLTIQKAEILEFSFSPDAAKPAPKFVLVEIEEGGATAVEHTAQEIVDYLLKEIHWHAAARTFLDDQVKEPGCVWKYPNGWIFCVDGSLTLAHVL